jgi:XTP/dITP diphosphohydrolase
MTPAARRSGQKMRHRLLVASGNSKKLKELQGLLSHQPVDLLSLKEFPKVVEIEEDGDTFRENAAKKALGFAKQTGCLTIADDSGLAVDFLAGAPGIYSARYAGTDKNDARNCEKLLTALKGVPESKRFAAFHCAVALATPERIVSVVEERVEGRITEKLVGDGGFGYDPLFFYPEFGKTFAQVPIVQKHSVSHRGKALRRMSEILNEYLATL